MSARKSMKDSLVTKKAIESNKEEISKEDLIIQKLEGKGDSLKKLTVEIPEHLHTKLKIASAQKGLKIRDIIIDLLEKM